MMLAGRPDQPARPAGPHKSQPASQPVRPGQPARQVCQPQLASEVSKPRQPAKQVFDKAYSEHILNMCQHLMF